MWIPDLRAATRRLGVLAAAVLCVGCATPAAQESQAPSATLEATSTPSASATMASTVSPTAKPSAEPGEDDIAWQQVAEYQGDGVLSVADVSAWDGGFLAVGHEWTGGFIAGAGASRIWSSPDGRAWTEVDTAPLGTSDVELVGILRPAGGGVVIIGDVGRQASFQPGGPHVRAGAWRSDDAESWAEIPLPFGAQATQGVKVASGPLGHVASTGSALWFSSDGANWDHVYQAAGNAPLRQPVAGDEGFVVSTYDPDADAARVLASGDGRSWHEAVPPVGLLGLASWRGDWLAWGYTADPQTISLLRSSNGLDWSVALDVNDLTPPDGPKAGLGMQSGITEASLAGGGGLAVMTLGWNHCCASPPGGVGVWMSTDAESWQAAALAESAYVTGMASDGDVVVLAGQLERGARVAFWLSE